MNYELMTAIMTLVAVLLGAWKAWAIDGKVNEVHILVNGQKDALIKENERLKSELNRLKGE